jgi:hypothetical protein
VLALFFPEEQARLDAMVEEAGLSRMYAGIHYRFDPILRLTGRRPRTSSVRLSGMLVYRSSSEVRSDGLMAGNVGMLGGHPNQIGSRCLCPE